MTSVVDLIAIPLSITVVSKLSSHGDHVYKPLVSNETKVVCPAVTAKGNEVITVAGLDSEKLASEEITPAVGLFIPDMKDGKGNPIAPYKVVVAAGSAVDALFSMPYVDGWARFVEIRYLDDGKEIVGIVPACHVVDDKLEATYSVAPPLPAFLLNGRTVTLDGRTPKGFVNVIPNDLFLALVRGSGLRWKPVSIMNTERALVFAFFTDYAENDVSGVLAIEEDEWAKVPEPKEFNVWVKALEKKLPIGKFKFIKKEEKGKIRSDLPNALI